jgi:hypothetical protein
LEYGGNFSITIFANNFFSTDHQLLGGNGGQALETQILECKKDGEHRVDGWKSKPGKIVLVNVQLAEVLGKK